MDGNTGKVLHQVYLTLDLIKSALYYRRNGHFHSHRGTDQTQHIGNAFRKRKPFCHRYLQELQGHSSGYLAAPEGPSRVKAGASREARTEAHLLHKPKAYAGT